ncbi:hypothetical protein PVAP13_1KG099700 [Panicum virgatum]|uniref:Secreted protein n=2 Tax=Panicum virgatum TaxID=38727 RepID=A0A8T0X507_PANVG|nr:hypothetical protein PVAP13_1KG099700 [Panicum virgatum]
MYIKPWLAALIHILCTLALHHGLLCDMAGWLDPVVATHCYIRADTRILRVHLLHSGFRQARLQIPSSQTAMNRQASRRGHRVRHVRLGSLLRLRVRLFGLAAVLVRCLEELNCCPRRWSPATARAHKMLSHADRCPRPGTAERENSFQAEAIADCLEFIKRSYLADDHKTAC